MKDKDYKVIAVCLADINEGYNTPLLQAFRKYAGQYNLKLLYFYSFTSFYQMEKHDIGERNIFQLINYELIDGICLLSQTIKDNTILEEAIQSAKKHDIPVISIDSPLHDCYNVSFNDTAIGSIAEHLISKHHITRFNYISGFRDNLWSEQRLSAFRRVLQAHGLTLEDERIGYGEFWEDPTNKVMDDFLSSDLPFPEAIVCANDAMAITAIDRLTAAGYRVPQDVIVTGFDGIREAIEHNPSITTAKNDFEQTVRTAFEIFLKIFEGKEPSKEYSINPKLIFGESCGCSSRGSSYHNELHRVLYREIGKNLEFTRAQIRMTADLTDKNSFQEVFDSIRDYAEEEFHCRCFWLCIVDNFLSQEELSDIINETAVSRNGYSNKMDLMLCKKNDEWLGMTDFLTQQILPNLEGTFEEVNNIIFFPLHVHEQNIGYAALSVDDTQPNINHCYQFFMNVSNALETTKSHLRQQMIIQTLENKYVHDPLTGLFNRRGFYQKIHTQYTECVENHHYFMIVSADLNGLKTINDTYGHADGDIAISTVAKALSSCAMNDEVCARFGGDEFVVAGKLSGEEDGQEYLKRIQTYLDEFNKSSGKPYQVSASIGLVQAVPNQDISLDEFINQADERMYSEKAKHHLSRAR